MKARADNHVQITSLAFAPTFRSLSGSAVSLHDAADSGGACLPAIRHCGAQGLCRHDGRSGHREDNSAQNCPQLRLPRIEFRTAFVFNPRLDVLDFLEFVLADFGIPPNARTKSGMLLQLNRWLIERFRNGSCAPLLSMKHRTSPGTLLEEIRLLTNLETASEKLLQIVLSGQPELEEKLRNPIVRQLRQRISLWCRTRPLTSDETEAYIAERLRIAGASQPVFSPEAYSLSIATQGAFLASSICFARHAHDQRLCGADQARPGANRSSRLASNSIWPSSPL